MSEQDTIDNMDWQLREVAPAFIYPPTPDIAGAVRQRLSRAGTPQRGARVMRSKLSWGLIALLLVVLLLAALLSVPQVQAFVRSLFRIGSVEIVVVPSTATPTLATPGPSATPSNPLNLVGETTLAIANAELPFGIKLPSYPADLGLPNRVFVQDLDGSALILAWTEPGRPDEARLVLYELYLGVAGRKEVEDFKVVEETTVGGRRAMWVKGTHLLQFYDARGNAWSGMRRLVQGNVLIWEEAGITYRLESTLPMSEAVRIAESLAPAEGIETSLPESAPTPPGWARNLVGATTLEQAQQRVNFPLRWPAYPSSLGEPDLVFLQERTGPMVVLAWYKPVQHERVQVLLYQMAEGPAAQETFSVRGVPTDTSVNGHAARWASGPHILSLYDEGGAGNLDSQRLARSNVLQWDEAGVAYRLEAPVMLSEALRIAESVVR
jgi:hypothetical protein